MHAIMMIPKYSTRVSECIRFVFNDEIVIPYARHARRCTVRDEITRNKRDGVDRRAPSSRRQEKLARDVELIADLAHDDHVFRGRATRAGGPRSKSRNDWSSAMLVEPLQHVIFASSDRNDSPTISTWYFRVICISALLWTRQIIAAIDIL